MYSSRYYNGIATGDIYLVRFISCVALHAVWSGAGAVLLYFNQDGLHGGFSFTDLASTLLMTQGISIIMHGLYDTLLKQEFPILALLIGIASVGWLIYVFERLAGDEDESVAIFMMTQAAFQDHARGMSGDSRRANRIARLFIDSRSKAMSCRGLPDLPTTPPPDESDRG